MDANYFLSRLRMNFSSVAHYLFFGCVLFLESVAYYIYNTQPEKLRKVANYLCPAKMAKGDTPYIFDHTREIPLIAVTGLCDRSGEWCHILLFLLTATIRRKSI